MREPRLILSYVTWIVCACALGTCGEPDKPDDIVDATGAENEIAVEADFGIDAAHKYNAFKEGGNVFKRFAEAVGPTGESVAYKITPVDRVQADLNEWETYYLQLKNELGYPYWVLSINLLYIGTNPDFTKTGVTLAAHGVVGEDSRPTHPFSFLVFHNIDTYAYNNGGDSRWWPMVFIHEMGHQRANLIDFHSDSAWANYHRHPQYNDGQYCVMHLMNDLSEWGVPETEMYESIMANLRYCGSGGDYDANPKEKSCLRFLKQREVEGSP